MAGAVVGPQPRLRSISAGNYYKESRGRHVIYPHEHTDSLTKEGSKMDYTFMGHSEYADIYLSRVEDDVRNLDIDDDERIKSGNTSCVQEMTKRDHDIKSPLFILQRDVTG